MHFRKVYIIIQGISLTKQYIYTYTIQTFFNKFIVLLKKQKAKGPHRSPEQQKP